MYRGGINPEAVAWVAYDYSTVLDISPRDVWFMKHFPTFFRKRFKLHDRARGEMQALEKQGINVEIVFWEPDMEEIWLAQAAMKRFKDPDFHKKFFTSAWHIRNAGYQQFYTNRWELLGFFNDEKFVCLTVFNTKVQVNKLIAEMSRDMRKRGQDEFRL